MFHYHVTFGSKKKKITVDDKTTVYDQIRQEFGVDSSTFSLQSWNTDFNDWVDVSDVTQLLDKGKLQLVVKGGHH